jgi:hypothetical protein
MSDPTKTPAPTPELRLSPRAAAIAASPQFEAWCANLAPTAGKSAGAHPLLDALAALLASPAGQALEAALINMILSLLTPKP